MPRLLLSFLLLLVLLPAAAVPVSDLYEVDVPVASQDREQRLEVLKQAFEEILVRVTGDGSVAGNPEVEPLLRRAAGFVQRFRYLPAPEGEEGWVLHAVFDARRIERALAERGLPVWGQDRPAVLAWVAIIDGGRRFLIGEQSHDAERAILADEARRRGLPLMFPLLDLQDQRQVRIADVTGGFDSTVDAASARYASDAVLIGTVRRSGSHWLGRWRLREGDETVRFESSGKQLDEALRLGVDGAASWLARWHARTALAGTGEGVPLLVEGVNGLTDYVRLRRYLAGLDGVEAVIPRRIAPPRAELEVRLRGEARDLQRMISLGDVLARVDEVQPQFAAVVAGSSTEGAVSPSDAPAPSMPERTRLHYRLLP